MLSEPTNYDLYIGVDVLNNAAGFTFVYAREGKCHFHHETSQQKEKLSKEQVETVIYAQVKLLIQDCCVAPSSVIFIRDGISHDCERRGAYAALKRLQKEGLLSLDLKASTVEMHKQSSIPLRLFDTSGSIQNPRIGDYYVLSDRDAFLCTTGYPFSSRGTAHPLQFRIVGGGSIDIEKMLEDVFGLAMLAWSAPDRPSRLPAVISLCDMFLQPIAGRVDEDSAEPEEAAEDEDEAEWS